MGDDRTTPRTFYRGVVNTIPQHTPGLRRLHLDLIFLQIHRSETLSKPRSGNRSRIHYGTDHCRCYDSISLHPHPAQFQSGCDFQKRRTTFARREQESKAGDQWWTEKPKMYADDSEAVRLLPWSTCWNSRWNDVQSTRLPCLYTRLFKQRGRGLDHAEHSMNGYHVGDYLLLRNVAVRKICGKTVAVRCGTSSISRKSEPHRAALRKILYIL